MLVTEKCKQMSQLIEGVKIVYTPLSIKNLQDRVLLNPGTQKANNLINDEFIYYNNGAIIPQESWRKVTELEHKILFNNQFDQEGKSWVSIIQLPKKIKNHLKILKNVKEPRVLKFILEDKNVINGIKATQEFINTFCHPQLSSQYSIGWNAPNQITVTTGKDNYKDGLHIDNYLNFPRHRILINLGSECRYFLFINISIKQIYNLVSKYHDITNKTNLGKSGLAIMFMELFPNYPVIQLRLDPGEAYIAPTEDIIHDGSTKGTHNLDIVFTMRSLFDFSIIPLKK